MTVEDNLKAQNEDEEMAAGEAASSGDAASVDATLREGAGVSHLPMADRAPEDSASSGDAASGDAASIDATLRRGDRMVRLGVNLIMVALVALAGLLAWRRLVQPAPAEPGAAPASAGAGQPAGTGGRGGPLIDSQALAAPGGGPLNLSPFATPAFAAGAGILRHTELRTIIPDRLRSTVVTYTVQAGDNLFSIAEQYGLKPETLLWSNDAVLKDNANLLSKGQALFIPPVDGAYYIWKDGDTIESVAAYYNVDPSAILNYAGNDIDLTQGLTHTFGLKPGMGVIIEGGKRPLKDWGPPAITRSNAAAARYYGEGACGAIYQGAVGSGTFVWPTTEHFLSGYDYTNIHHGIDIAGSIGNSIFAADSGVVVFAGFSNFGYGLLTVIDHGNGFQTAYAHMSAIAVTCGQNVFQGGYIGALGSTGNSTGPHLHFEVMYNGAKVNPWDYVR